MSSCVRILLVSASFLCLASASQATTVTLLATDSGWHSSAGNHTFTNQTYSAGWSNDVELRNFFVFNLSGFDPGRTILSATLRAYNPADDEPDASYDGGYQSSDASETYQLHEVLTPASVVTAPSVGNPAVFNDLGDGDVFGSVVSTLADNGQDIDVVLNAAGISHLQTFVGVGQVVLGGLLTTLTATIGTDESIWALTDPAGFGPYDRELIITFVPEPSTALLLGMGLVGIAARRRQRA